MPTFQYRAIQTNGSIAEGLIEAGGRLEALRQVEGRGLRPIKLTEQGNGKGPKTKTDRLPKMDRVAAAKSSEPAKNTLDRSGAESAPGGLQLSFGRSTKISGRVLENFTRLLSSLLAAGVPLSRALVILCKEASAPAA